MDSTSPNQVKSQNFNGLFEPKAVSADHYLNDPFSPRVKILVPGYQGTVADAWISQGEPFQELAAFEQFQVYRPNTNNMVKLLARVKPGASVKMKFDIVVLCAARLPD